MTNHEKTDNMFQKMPVIVLLALFCCLLWGSAFPCIKIGYQMLEIQGAGSQILFAGYRFFLAGILTFLMGCLMEKKIILMQKSSVPYVFGQGILQTTIQYVFFYLGLAHTTGAKGSVLNASNTFFAIILAHFLLKNEKITMGKAVGCIIGFAGVIVINLAPGAWGGGFHLMGEGFIILCSLAYGASSVTLKLISHREKPVTITAYQLLFGGFLLIIIGLMTGGKVTGFTFASSALLFYMALLSTIAFSIWATLLKYNPVGRITIFGFSIPIFGVALSALLLGENVWNLNNLLALILVSVGIIAVNLPEKSGRNH